MIFPSSLKIISVITRLLYSSQPFIFPWESHIWIQRFSLTGKISTMVQCRKSYLLNMALNNALMRQYPLTGEAGGIHNTLSSLNHSAIRVWSLDCISSMNARILSFINSIYDSKYVLDVKMDSYMHDFFRKRHAPSSLNSKIVAQNNIPGQKKKFSKVYFEAGYGIKTAGEFPAVFIYVGVIALFENNVQAALASRPFSCNPCCFHNSNIYNRSHFV